MEAKQTFIKGRIHHYKKKQLQCQKLANVTLMQATLAITFIAAAFALCTYRTTDGFPTSSRLYT